MTAVVFAIAEARDGTLWFKAPPIRRQWTRALWEALLYPTADEAAAQCQGEEQRVFPLVLQPALDTSEPRVSQA